MHAFKQLGRGRLRASQSARVGTAVHGARDANAAPSVVAYVPPSIPNSLTLVTGSGNNTNTASSLDAASSSVSFTMSIPCALAIQSISFSYTLTSPSSTSISSWHVTQVSLQGDAFVASDVGGRVSCPTGSKTYGPSIEFVISGSGGVPPGTQLTLTDMTLNIMAPILEYTPPAVDLPAINTVMLMPSHPAPSATGTDGAGGGGGASSGAATTPLNPTFMMGVNATLPANAYLVSLDVEYSVQPMLENAPHPVGITLAQVGLNFTNGIVNDTTGNPTITLTSTWLGPNPFTINCYFVKPAPSADGIIQLKRMSLYYVDFTSMGASLDTLAAAGVSEGHPFGVSYGTSNGVFLENGVNYVTLPNAPPQTPPLAIPVPSTVASSPGSTMSSSPSTSTSGIPVPPNASMLPGVIVSGAGASSGNVAPAVPRPPATDPASNLNSHSSTTSFPTAGGAAAAAAASPPTTTAAGATSSSTTINSASVGNVPAEHVVQNNTSSVSTSPHASESGTTVSGGGSASTSLASPSSPPSVHNFGSGDGTDIGTNSTFNPWILFILILLVLGGIVMVMQVQASSSRSRYRRDSDEEDV